MKKKKTRNKNEKKLCYYEMEKMTATETETAAR